MKRLSQYFSLVIIFIFLSSCSSVSKVIQPQHASKPDIVKIKGLLGQYSKAFYAEDIDRLMQSFDRDAPDYLRAKSVFLKAFRNLNLKGNLDSVSLIGTSGKYTFVRLKQTFLATLPSPLTGGKSRSINAQQDLVFALVTTDQGYKIWRVVFLKALEPGKLQ